MHPSNNILCYTINTGKKSYRNESEGSWYIQEICNVFFENAAEMDVEDMLKEVNFIKFI